MEKVFSKQEYPVSAFYLFANVTLLNRGQILLTLSEDGAARNIWVPIGGEVKVREGQIPIEAAVAESWEEVGLKLNPRKLILIGEPQLVYPTEEYNPYPAKGEEGGAGLIIWSYLYTGIWSSAGIKLNKVPEKGCLIKEYKLVRLPASMGEIEKWPFEVYPNYAEKLLEISNFLD